MSFDYPFPAVLLAQKATIVKSLFWVEYCPCFEVVDECKSSSDEANLAETWSTLR